MPSPVISVAQMREWEKASWARGRHEEEVIRRVGRALVATALRLTKPTEFILLLAGRGNNGADVRATLELFDDRRLDILEVKDPAADLAELQTLLAIRPALVIDGLFGIGMNRPLDAAWQHFIQTLNDALLPVLSADVPSGLNADTGEPFGAAVQATVTLTVGAPKAGLLKQSAWRYVGRLEVAHDVGMVEDFWNGHPAETWWTLPADFTDFPPVRPVAGHKGSFGHVGIVAGSRGCHGAAVLATRGAQRAQPGLVTLLAEEAVYLPIAAQLQAAMVHPWEPKQKLPATFSALLIGPGLAAPAEAERLKSFTREMWKTWPGPLVVDASALDWLEPAAFPAGAVRVLTPHPGEAARLLGVTAEQIQADRPAAVRAISKRFGGCLVVLKGHQTLIGGEFGAIFVNSSGNPLLAQGGSGDLLAGLLTGLLAQPALQREVLRTVRYAVWRHGAAADALTATKPNWVVEDLAAAC
ncbi:MAG: NAD(P)H-hydrate dehydratase [Verrucomicrobiota bacterium]